MRATLIYREPESPYKTRLTFSVDTKDIPEVPNDCEIIIRKYHSKRNEDQNAKYWSNLRILSNSLDIPITVMHNQMLSDYGVWEQDEDGNIIKVVMKDNFDYQASDLHLFQTKYTTEIDGVTYRLFYKLKDSSRMNTQEFAKLIDGLLSEMENCELRSE